MKLKILIGLVVTLIFAVCLLVYLGAPTPPDDGPLPSPNGFDTIVEAGQKMIPVPMDFDSSQDVDHLNDYLQSNTQALSLIDTALKQEYQVPPSELAAAVEFPEGVALIRSIARLLFVQARVLELEGRSDEAADALVKIVVLGNRSSNGGLLLHQMTADASQQIGIDALLQLAGKLSAEKKSELRDLLQKEFANPPTNDAILEKIIAREHYQARQRMGSVMGSIAIWQTSELVGPAVDAARGGLERSRQAQNNLIKALAPVDQ